MAIDLAALTAPCADVFGESVTFKPAAGGSFSIPGIFDEAYRALSVAGDGPAFTTSVPVVGVRMADFPSPPLQNDWLVRESTGEYFTVKEVRSDGHGWAQLMLNFVR